MPPRIAPSLPDATLGTQRRQDLPRPRQHFEPTLGANTWSQLQHREPAGLSQLRPARATSHQRRQCPFLPDAHRRKGGHSVARKGPAPLSFAPQLKGERQTETGARGDPTAKLSPRSHAPVTLASSSPVAERL